MTDITAAISSRRRKFVGWSIAGVAVLLFALAIGPIEFLRTLLLGLPQGGIIALIAIGYSMVYGIIQLINFAHGEIFMLSAYMMLMFLWSPQDFPQRIVGFPLFVPLILGVLLAYTGFTSVNTMTRSTVRFRLPSRRWPLAIAGGVLFGFACYWSFLSDGFLGGFASVLTALAAAAGIRAWLASRDHPPGVGAMAGASLGGGVAIGGVLYVLLLGGNVFSAGLVVSMVITATIGLTLDTVAYRPLRTAPRLIPLITAIGMSIFFQSLAQVIWGATPARPSDELLPAVLRSSSSVVIDGETRFITNDFLYEQPLLRQIAISQSVIFRLHAAQGDDEVDEYIRIPLIDILIVGLTLGVFGLLQLLVYKTRLGKAMRACAQDKRTARLVGVNVDTVVGLTFIIGSMLAALASPLYVVKYSPVEPVMGLIVGILAFSSAVLGGIGNIKGAMLGGLLIGIIYNFVPSLESIEYWPLVTQYGILPEEAATWLFENVLDGISRWRLGVAYGTMILVIIVKPTGLFGRAAAHRA